ncbi:UNVERIFIED_CONTAM: hypothetical protein FKN15_027950 [Acipenser sinensis]
MNTRCPPKRVPSSRPLFFTLQTHHAATQELQRRRTTQLSGSYRGRWCASDNLLSYLTVQETLTYTAQLALRKHSPEAIRKKFTAATPRRLGKRRNTRPPKCVPANLSFYTLWIHSEATRPIVPENNTDLNGFHCRPTGVAGER